MKVTPEQLDASVKSVDFLVHEGTCLTTCVLQLQNGYTVSGQSACADPAEFDKATGEHWASVDAKKKIWPLLGYELKTKLHLMEQAGAPTGKMAELGGQTFVGQKAVHAVPMFRGPYNELRGWAIPKDEDPDELGYLVEYVDGGKPNVEGFTGYVSWSPKDVFDAAYGEGVTIKKTTHVERMIKELETVSENVGKLSDFIAGNPIFLSLVQAEQEDMTFQLRAMINYQFHLSKRVERAMNAQG